MWDAETGRELLALKGHTEGVRCVAFRPDGGQVAAMVNGYWPKVCLWEVETGKEVARYTIAGEGGAGVPCSPYTGFGGVRRAVLLQRHGRINATSF